MKKSGASLDEKEIHELWCPLNTIHAITACKVEIHRKENLLLSSAEKKKKKKWKEGTHRLIHLFYTYIEKKNQNITNCGETASLLQFLLWHLPRGSLNYYNLNREGK